MDKANIKDIYPLTPTQEGILWHCLLEPGESLYWNQNSFRLEGELDVGRFKAAWKDIVQRHDALRAVYNWSNPKRPLQIIVREVDPVWNELDWSECGSSLQKARFEQLLETDRQAGYNLQKSPLMRHYLIRLGDRKWRFLWANHHILLDGWSVAIVLNEFLDTYKGLPFQAPAGSFKAHVDWLQSLEHTQAVRFFGDYLDGFREATPLPLARSRDGVALRGSAFAEESLAIPAPELAKLSDQARHHRLTLNTVFQALWALVLSCYSGRDDVAFGAVFSGRTSPVPDIDKTVGLFINTVPVRVAIDRELPFWEWTAQFKDRQADLHEFQHTPLRIIQKGSAIPANQPIFDSLFVFENYPDGLNDKNVTEQLAVSDIRSDERDNYPLTFLVVNAEGIQLTLCYDADRFSEEGITRILNHMGFMVRSLLHHPGQSVASLMRLPEDQEAELVSLAQSSAFPLPATETLCTLVEKAARASGNSAAVSCNSVDLSYDALLEQTRRWAGRLRLVVGTGSLRIGVCFERSTGMIVALQAVLNAGYGYVPLDPNWPVERLRLIIRDSGIQFVITGKGKAEEKLGRVRNEAAEAPGLQLLVMDPESADTVEHAEHGHEGSPSPDSEAYVIHTSGSTGTPKGVLVSHANAVNATLARHEFYPNKPKRFLLLSPIVFDSSVAGIFWTLSSGGSLVLPEPGAEKDPAKLADLIHRHKITHILCLPSLHASILNHLDANCALETVIVAGEPCPSGLSALHRKVLPQTALFNEYGPTETTVWCTAQEITHVTREERIPIGKPVPNARVFIMDPHQNLLPKGVPGELVVGGKGVTAGYLGQAQLTAERFLKQAVFNGEPERLYRTGDLARWRDDGMLEFLGRIDEQVKIRGYRIEPGEIEAALEKHESVELVVVIPHDMDLPVPDNSQTLEELIKRVDSEELESAVNEVQALTQRPEKSAIRESFRLELYPMIPDFIKPPRTTQRNWMLGQAMAEFADDLEHLHQIAPGFARGGDGSVEFDSNVSDITQASLPDDRIMEDWQAPIMAAMADYVTESHGDVLEIGFGRGISATMIQQQGVRSHSIVEVNDHSVDHFFKPWREQYADRDIRLYHKLWQDVEPDLGLYDGIFFHAFPLNEKEFVDYVLKSVTFAEHAFPVMAKHLRPGGVFTYLTLEIDSLSRRHQRSLFKHFKSLTTQVVPVEVPDDTTDIWWADRMVVIKAVKA